jgi:hypothetical protein
MADKRTGTAQVLFLHHSTGANVWQGGVAEAIRAHNREKGSHYTIVEQAFPKESPYGWANYPYDYWNIWVQHAGAEPYMEEPTLEILAGKYDLIVFKHCFPVASVEADDGAPDIASQKKTLGNYKLQYEALKRKLREFRRTKFLVWTGAALSQSATNEAEARRAAEFFAWVRNSWDEKGDNIFLWDFAQLETEGGLWLKKEFEAQPGDSHPGPAFCKRVAPLLARRIVNVLEGRGDAGSLTGEAAAS